MARVTLFVLPVSFFLAIGVLSAQVGGQPPGDAVYLAIRGNDLTGLGALLKAGEDANTVEPRGGMTPLMHAAVSGSREAMTLLLDKGASVNTANGAGVTALMMSVTDIDKVNLLLAKGADVNAVTKRGRSALLLAAMSDGSAPIVRLLIAKGADPKVVDTFKVNALNAAARGNDLETIRIIADAGVPVNDADFAGVTPLIAAASSGNVQSVKLLLAKGANVNAVSGDGSFQKVKAGTIALGNFTALLSAAASGSLEMVTVLLDAGADVNAKDVRGMTPLMLAVATDHQSADVVRAFINRKADVNVRSLAGETALDWARKIGNPTTVRLLERAGAVAGTTPVPLKSTFDPADSMTAVKRSLALLEKSSTEAAAQGGCASCHHHNVTDIAGMIARDKGIALDQKAAADRRQLTRARMFAPANFFERLEAGGFPDVELYALTALSSSGEEPDRATDAVLASILAQQRANGSWSLGLGGVARPPIEDGDIFRTALAMSVIKSFGPPGRSAEIARRMSLAARWLDKASPVTTEDRNMQLIGLQCSGTDEKTLQRLSKAILSAQRADGGWAQTAFLSSDAYATGQTMVALVKTGVLNVDAPAYQRALRYLISTQHADGSWYVRSRSPKFQPFFESGFPYGHDQWISAMATGWAASAVAMALP
jgi:ankyrin repeat protein